MASIAPVARRILAHVEAHDVGERREPTQRRSDAPLR
jgi:hypothetical protein